MGVVHGHQFMRKVIAMILMLAVMALILAGCTEQYPYVKIVRSNWTRDTITIPIGHGYHLTKQMFTIEEHTDGYDIIIHVKAGVEND